MLFRSNLPVVADIKLDPDIPTTGSASILDLSNASYVDNVDFTSNPLASNPGDQAIFRKKSGTGWQDSALGDGSDSSDFYLSAPAPVNSSFVEKTTPAFSWVPPTNPITYPTPVSTNQLNATCSVTNGTLTYALTNGTNVSMNTVLPAGTNKIIASFTPTDTNAYNIPSPITNTLVVNKGTPTITWNSQIGRAHV